MQTITIPKSVTGSEELIIMPKKEYNRMKDGLFPIFYLNGSTARKLDKRVREGLREYNGGKTEPLKIFLKREFPRLAKKYEH